jgi:hypothetical protein
MPCPIQSSEMRRQSYGARFERGREEARPYKTFMRRRSRSTFSCESGGKPPHSIISPAYWNGTRLPARHNGQAAGRLKRGLQALRPALSFGENNRSATIKWPSVFIFGVIFRLGLRLRGRRH